MRDEFKKVVVKTVAARAGYHCSNPRCQKLTSGPVNDPKRALSIGVAAHIAAASPGGPRFDATLSSDQRSSIENAIWLCQSCGTLVDRDCDQFAVDTLHNWKRQAERSASIKLAAGTEFRAIAKNELRQEITVAELAAIRALSDEFGCEVRQDVSVLTGDGWINLHAAVVQGEDLVAVEIRENKGHGIPYFQIEYLIELGASLKFDRFQKFVLYVAIVSGVSPELDEPVLKKLEQIAATAPLEVNIRMYRLNTLLAKYNL